MAHGTMDPMVPYRGGRQSKDALERLGYRVEWHEYPMAHAVCPQEIRDIRAWLLTTFGISGSPGSWSYENEQFMFNLKAGNNQVIGTSESYESVSARDNGIESVKKNAPGAKIDDQT